MILEKLYHENPFKMCKFWVMILLSLLFISCSEHYTKDNPRNDCNASPETVKKLIELNSHNSKYLDRDVFEFRTVCSDSTNIVKVQWRVVEMDILFDYYPIFHIVSKYGWTPTERSWFSNMIKAKEYINIIKQKEEQERRYICN